MAYWTLLDGCLVGVRGFEPPAPASRTQCSTKLSYTPMDTNWPFGDTGPTAAQL